MQTEYRAMAGDAEEVRTVKCPIIRQSVATREQVNWHALPPSQVVKLWTVLPVFTTCCDILNFVRKIIT